MLKNTLIKIMWSLGLIAFIAVVVLLYKSADGTKIIILATALASTGTLVDLLIRRHHKNNIRSWLEFKVQRITNFSFPDIPRQNARNALKKIRWVFGLTNTGFYTFLVKYLFSICLTALAMTTASAVFESDANLIECVYCGFHYAAIILAIIVLGWAYSASIIRELLPTIFVVYSILTAGLYFFPVSMSHLDFLPAFSDRFFWEDNNVLNGLINFVFDLLTLNFSIWALWHVLNTRFSLSQFVYICIDLVAAILFAGCSFWLLMYFNEAEIWTLSDMLFIANYLSLDQYHQQYLFAASTTLIPTIFYLGTLLVLILTKLIANGVSASSVYLFRARLEDDDPKAFTVVGLVLGVLVLLVRVVQ